MRWIYELEAWVNTTDPLWWNLGFCALLVVAFMLLDKLMGWDPSR